ncbi:hypothetical protein [uncultured Jatrophihabitans sp.]|uniref:hypothetical protein n=1 Tax=uncultured Jatrophihabitans sp. TaxID=1610747 RepID=UPI0035CA6E21
MSSTSVTRLPSRFIAAPGVLGTAALVCLLGCVWHSESLRPLLFLGTAFALAGIVVGHYARSRARAAQSTEASAVWRRRGFGLTLAWTALMGWSVVWGLIMLFVAAFSLAGS